MLALVAPVQATDSVALSDRGQLLRDTLYLERDIALLQERLSAAGPRALVFYIELEPSVLSRFQAFLIRVDGRAVFEQLLTGLNDSSSSFKPLHRVALAAGEHSVEVRLVGKEDSFSEMLEFTKGDGRDHIRVRSFSPKPNKAPTIELTHEQWGALR